MSSIASVGNSAIQYLSSASVNSASQSSASTSTAPTGRKHHHHGSGGGGGDLMSKLQSAVSSALSSNDDSTTDPNTTITNAIAAFLKQGTGAASGTPTGTGATIANTSAGDETSATGGQTFAQMLAAHGVTEESFGADLQAAFQQAQGDSGAGSTTGNLLDVAA